MKSAPLADHHDSPEDGKGDDMKKNSVLGKGLSALIQGADLTGMTTAPNEDNSIHLVPLENIGFNPEQPRKSFDNNNLKELANSIKQVGILQPVLVRHLQGTEKASQHPDSGVDPALISYCVVAGERRVRAARLKIPRPLRLKVLEAIDEMAAVPSRGERPGFQHDQADEPLRVDRQFAVGGRGAAMLIAEFARRHIERGADWGRIIGLTSGGPEGFPGEVSYGAAKAALQNYTMSAAFELAPHGIQVNAIAPGWVETDMTAPIRTEDLKAMNDEIMSRTPAGRWGQPEEMAGPAIFLASQASDFVTGETIRVDGGYAIR